MNADVVGLVGLVVLLAGNAFFVGAEFAVIAARRSQIEPRAAAGSRAARTTLWAMEHATLMLATSQLGITVCSLLILTVSEPALHHLLEGPLGLTPLAADAVGVVAFVVALLVVTFLHVVLGEMVPKNLAFSVPDRAALLLAPPLVAVSRAVRPVIAALNAVANAVVRRAGVEPRDEAASAFTLEEVAGIVETSRQEGTLGDDDGPLAGAFEFTELSVADLEVPLERLVTLPDTATPADLQDAVRRHGFSRYVIVRAGDPVGYLHLKDVMELPATAFGAPVPTKRLRRLPAVPRDAELEDGLAVLRREAAHVGRTVDREGRPHGVLFLADAVEVLVSAAGSADAG